MLIFFSFSFFLSCVYMHVSRWMWVKCVGTQRTWVCVNYQRQRCRPSLASLCSRFSLRKEGDSVEVCHCLWACTVCVWVREREREKWQRGKQSKRVCVCMLIFLWMSIWVYVRVCVRTQQVLDHFMMSSKVGMLSEVSLRFTIVLNHTCHSLQ